MLQCGECLWPYEVAIQVYRFSGYLIGNLAENALNLIINTLASGLFQLQRNYVWRMGATNGGFPHQEFR